MKRQNIIGIWLAAFDSEDELRDFVDWKYKKNQDNSSCKFAQAIKVRYFDHDFMECLYSESPTELLSQLDHISFIEYFKEPLLAKIKSIPNDKLNSIISLMGQKSIYGNINEFLFDFKSNNPTIHDLQFMGLYEFEK